MALLSSYVWHWWLCWLSDWWLPSHQLPLEAQISPDDRTLQQGWNHTTLHKCPCNSFVSETLSEQSLSGQVSDRLISPVKLFKITSDKTDRWHHPFPTCGYWGRLEFFPLKTIHNSLGNGHAECPCLTQETKQVGYFSHLEFFMTIWKKIYVDLLGYNMSVYRVLP